MTICEALRISKETGKTFSRRNEVDMGYGGWIRFDESHEEYRYLTAKDLMADDWEADGVDVQVGGEVN